jgi:hypothetical protein
MRPDTGFRVGVIGLGRPAVDEQRLTGQKMDHRVILADNAAAADGIEQKITVLEVTYRIELAVRIENAGFRTVEGLFQCEIRRCGPKPEASSFNIQVIGKHNYYSK